MSENVKKIRELNDFVDEPTPISIDDILIIATGPDDQTATPPITRRDQEGNSSPVAAKTLKATIDAVMKAYNASLIPPSGGGSTTDPSDRPNAELPKPGGGTYFQDTTPFTAANLDVMIKSGCGIEVVEECHNASEVSVDCSSADLKYKTKKLCLSNIPFSALDTTSGAIDPAALSLDAGDDFEIDSNGNLKLKDGVGGGTADLTSDPVSVHIVKDVDDDYADLMIRNTAETGRGAIVKMGVNSTGSPQADKVSEQLSVQIQGSNTANGPRGALTYQNFNASAIGGGTGAVSNLFIDGGRISGYSNFDLISHVETNGEMTLGKASMPWKQIWLNENQATPSDERKKQDILDIDEAERAVAVKAKALLKKFRYKEAFKQKGEDARIHFGIIAQELIEAFESEGLDPMKYSMICYDEWWRNPEDFTDVKEEETEGYTHEGRYSIRYSELLAFIIAAI